MDCIYKYDRQIDLDKLIRLKKKEIINEHDLELLQYTYQDLEDRKNQILKNRKQLAKLLKIPKIPQKSAEWYRVRNLMITASDWAQALGEGKFGTQNELIKKKCYPLDESGFVDNKYFRWGNMFEDVAIEIYSHEMKVKVYEFGLVQHGKFSWFGASPDGISNMGVMLEIKCPLKRKLDGKVPNQYLYQVQGQLDVCSLDECDYFECDIKPYCDSDDFFQHLSDSKVKGIVIETIPNSTLSKWIYSKIAYSNNESLQEYFKNFVEINKGISQDICYWYLNGYNLQRIYRDQEFIDKNLTKLKDVWDKILYYRQHEPEFKRDIIRRIAIETEDYTETSYAFKDDI